MYSLEKVLRNFRYSAIKWTAVRSNTTLQETEFKGIFKKVENDSKIEPPAEPEPQPDYSNDPFAQEHVINRIQINGFQRALLSAGSSVAALIDPARQDMIACLGEVSGQNALNDMYATMKNSEEGLQLLKDKPRINTNTVDLNVLSKLPENTFGYHYVKFLEVNGVSPDTRLPVRFINDPDLAYVMTRYRECHDLVHVILGMPTNMLGEVAVKWIEAFNFGLPMCYTGAVFGAARLKPKQRKKYTEIYLPWIANTAKNIKPLMSVYWEKRWEQDIGQLRAELNIQLI